MMLVEMLVSLLSYHYRTHVYLPQRLDQNRKVSEYSSQYLSLLRFLLLINLCLSLGLNRRKKALSNENDHHRSGSKLYLICLDQGPQSLRINGRIRFYPLHMKHSFDFGSLLSTISINSIIFRNLSSPLALLARLILFSRTYHSLKTDLLITKNDDYIGDKYPA